MTSGRGATACTGSRCASRPTQLRAIAAQLYVELLRGGYTQVCEFHYLQHAEDGTPYADPATLAWSLADAAGDAGIGLTVLPVLYERAGFADPALRPDQRRFASTPDFVLRQRDAVRAAGRPLVNAGVAIHSLRAASAASIADADRADSATTPARSTSTSPSRPPRSMPASPRPVRGRSNGCAAKPGPTRAGSWSTRPMRRRPRSTRSPPAAPAS